MLTRFVPYLAVVGLGLGISTGALAGDCQYPTTKGEKTSATKTTPGSEDWVSALDTQMNRDLAQLRATFERVWSDWPEFPALSPADTGGAVNASIRGQPVGSAAPSALQVSTRDGGGAVVMEVKAPGVDPSAIHVSLEGDHLNVSYNLKNVDEQKDAKGNVVARSESERHLFETIPVPENVSTAKAKIETSGNAVLVRLPRAA